MTVESTDRVTLRRLSVVPDGDDVLIGDPDTGTFVAVPVVGGIVVTALLEGRTIGEARARAEEAAGEPVDVAAFVDTLAELGFVDDGASVAAAPTAPVQQRGWLAGVSQRWARPLFGRVAWFCYAAAAVFCVLVFALRPDLWPRPADALLLSDAGLSMLVLVPLSYLLVGLHESWHWLAARSLGLRTRFGVDRRLYFLVFETDLSQLWSVPRRARYGPQLAGLAVDMVVLTVLLVVLLIWPGQRLAAALAFATVVTTVWQCMIFLRTDLYGVLVTATGCRDLWRTKTLLLRRAFGRLDAEQAAELAEADSRDVRVGRWFRWLWLIGCAVALGYFALFYVPLIGYLFDWTADGLRDGTGWRFVWTLAGSALLYLPFVAAAAIALLERRRTPRPT